MGSHPGTGRARLQPSTWGAVAAVAAEWCEEEQVGAGSHA